MFEEFDGVGGSDKIVVLMIKFWSEVLIVFVGYDVIGIEDF